jgi:hypothetical protein
MCDLISPQKKNECIKKPKRIQTAFQSTKKEKKRKKKEKKGKKIF